MYGCSSAVTVGMFFVSEIHWQNLVSRVVLKDHWSEKNSKSYVYFVWVEVFWILYCRESYSSFVLYLQRWMFWLVQLKCKLFRENVSFYTYNLKICICFCNINTLHFWSLQLIGRSSEQKYLIPYFYYPRRIATDRNIHLWMMRYCHLVVKRSLALLPRSVWFKILIDSIFDIRKYDGIPICIRLAFSLSFYQIPSLAIGYIVLICISLMSARGFSPPRQLTRRW